ncbi:dynamin family protein [Candidatus Merdisoma sp. JLR.KK006]|uniref:dynamin family protein n=1 Tax=Candidatus Merdisoma sp. JLR.KK006 TaxID=3112626 RepID=UPI002FF07BD7
MKKVFIKYNPYKLETEITVEGKKLAQNSNLGERSAPGTRFQEWVEDLPKLLVEEYNDTDFEIVFHGTLLDYEDLTEVFTEAYKKGQLTAKLERKPAKETSDKEVLIDEVFKKIQEGPFEELRAEEIKSAFEHAKSSDFEVCVVATMSAGKSTLINAMLCDKLMPSKQEACTAIITRLKDNDNDTWQAEVYNKENCLIETHEALNYQTMERLNGDESVSMIKAVGNIPFVTAEDVSLVLVDTPGPNNARDPEHEKVQSKFLGTSSKSLVLYIMEGTFGSVDDDNLLKRVAESMSVGGKQSKDRFLFVVSKMDDRRKEDGDTQQMLNRVREYLSKHGIENPNLFPAAALPALNIRLIEKGVELDEDTMDETELKVKKLNRNEQFYLENYATLPGSVSGKIKDELSKAEKSNEKNEQALIHTGVPSVEAAIRQYVQKYAKTAKIKNIVDAFRHNLDEAKCFEDTKCELARRQEEREKFIKMIDSIEQKIKDIEGAKKFDDAVNDAVKKVKIETQNIVDGIVKKFQINIQNRIKEKAGEEWSKDEAQYEYRRLEKYAQKLEPDFQEELDEMIRQKLISTGERLLEEYKRKLISLTEDININEISEISIDPLKLMGGSIISADSIGVERFIQTKKVEDGEEWVKNTDKKWYKPWTWLQESGYYRTKYKNVEYIKASELVHEFFSPIESGLYNNGRNAKEYADMQSEKIAELFRSEFGKLDEKLKEKLKELKDYATNKEKAEERIKESESKLTWLEKIQTEVESILEI